MPTIITYKGETLATFTDVTKTMLTTGKYMEDDITITSSEQNEFPTTVVKMSYVLSGLDLSWQISAEENI